MPEEEHEETEEEENEIEQSIKESRNDVTDLEDDVNISISSIYLIRFCTSKLGESCSYKTEKTTTKIKNEANKKLFVIRFITSESGEFCLKKQTIFHD